MEDTIKTLVAVIEDYRDENATLKKELATEKNVSKMWLDMLNELKAKQEAT